jgi:hypothetical protein
MPLLEKSRQLGISAISKINFWVYSVLPILEKHGIYLCIFLNSQAQYTHSAIDK